MSENNVIDLAGREGDQGPLTALLRTRARTLIQSAVEAELKELLDSHRDRRLKGGRAGVVRKGYQPERQLQTGIGPVTVRILKVPVRATQVRHRG